MKKLLFICLLFLSGCSAGDSMDWLAPDVSKSITEKEQKKELEKQNQLIERQTIALEKIAKYIETK